MCVVCVCRDSEPCLWGRYTFLVQPKLKGRPLHILISTKSGCKCSLSNKEDMNQILVYFVNHALTGLKLNYLRLKRLVLTVITAQGN